MIGFTCVVVGENPGKQLKTFDASVLMPPSFEEFDRNELQLWRELAVHSEQLGHDAGPEEFLKVLQEAGVPGFKEATVMGSRIGRMSTENPQARFGEVHFDELPSYFLHRNGTRSSRMLVRDLDLEGIRAERAEVAERRYREFEQLTMGITRPPRPAVLARRQVEKGLTFNNAVFKAQRIWMAHPWVEAVFYHRWDEDPYAPQRGGANFWLSVGMANDFDPYLAFCQEFPDPKAEFIRREVLAAGVSGAYVLHGQWHCIYDEPPAETMVSGQAAAEYRDGWMTGMRELYEGLPPETKLTAVVVRG